MQNRFSLGDGVNVFLDLAMHDLQWSYPLLEPRFQKCLYKFGWSASDAESADLHFYDVTRHRGKTDSVFSKPTILFIRCDTSWPIHDPQHKNVVGYCVPIMTTDPSSSICRHVHHSYACNLEKPVFYLTTMLWHQLDVQEFYSDIQPIDKKWDVSFIGTMHHFGSRFVKQHRANLRRAWGQLDEFPSVAIFAADVAHGGYAIPWKESWKIVKRSRTIVSPWGVCEISWRDYEAALAGCMMIKPRQPEIKATCSPWHKENVIYCQPDYSDLADRVLDSLNTDRSALAKISQETLAAGKDFNVLAKAFAGILDKACST